MSSGSLALTSDTALCLADSGLCRRPLLVPTTSVPLRCEERQATRIYEEVVLRLSLQAILRRWHLSELISAYSRAA